MLNQFNLTKLLTIAFAFSCLPACSVLVSDNPFYKSEQVVKEPALAGKWWALEDADIKSLTLTPKDDALLATFVPKEDKDTPPNLTVVIFRLGDHLLADLQGGYASPHDNPGVPATAHQLVPVGASGSRIFFLSANGDGFDKLLQDNAQKIKIEVLGEHHDALHLKDETDVVQKFVKENFDALFAGQKDQNWQIAYFQNGNNLPIDDGDGLFSKKQRTFTYWWLMSRAIRAADFKDASMDEIKQRADNFVESAEMLSSDGVDPEATKAGAQIIELFKKISDSSRDEKINTAGTLAAMADVLKATGAIPADANEMRDHFDQSAKTLSDHYKLAFPTIAF